MTLANLGHALRELGRRPEALAVYEEAIKRREQFVRDNPGVPSRLCDLAGVLAAASLCTPNGEPYAPRAVDLLRQAVNQGFNDAARLVKDPILEPLRRRTDFIDLLWDLADNPPSKR